MKTLVDPNPYCSMSAYEDDPLREDRFGRLFGHLAPAYTNPRILADIGAVNGPMDGQGDDDRTNSVAVGQIFFGQFIDHDITLDASTSFNDVINNAADVPNVRTPTLDLDCIYGLGPEAQPYLFVQGGDFGGAKLLTGADNPGQSGINDHDLLRAPNGRAIIGDPRNDENRVISQIQLAIIRFHNLVCDTLNAEDGLTGHDLYEEARQVTTWHYQWALVNDFLVQLCGLPVVERILGCGREHYCPPVPFIPVEFSVAAFRFGHSMIPQRVRTREDGAFLRLFQDLGGAFAEVTDPIHIVDWNQLLDTPAGGFTLRSQLFDTKMARTLLQLPFVDPPGEASLITRNLLRSNAFLIPGGEKIAADIGRDQAEIDSVIAKIAELDPRLGSDGIPLWLYLLAEGEVIGRAEPDGTTTPGEALGPVGATIVAEVMIGLLELDDRSYLGANRNWSPREEWDTLGKLVVAAQPALPAVP
ncbi:MAG: heme peroxidase family protein [Pseudomonadota bacterium]